MKKSAISISFILLACTIAGCGSRAVPSLPASVSEQSAYDTESSEYFMPEGEGSEFEEPEDATKIWSYITESTDPPIHFDTEAIREEAKNVALAVWPIYQKAEAFDDGNNNIIYILTEQEVTQIVEIIGSMGYAAGSRLTDTQHPEIIRSFVKAIENKGKSNIGIYSINGSGRLQRTSLSYTDGEAFVTTIDVANVDGTPVVSEITSEKKLDVCLISERGFFFFGNEGLGWDGLKDGYLLEPIGNTNRELQKKYIDPLMGYTGHNILLTNWNQSNMNDLSFNDVFEMLYQFDSGLNPMTEFRAIYANTNAYTNAVPAFIFEGIILKYFNLTPQELRKIAVYNPEQDAYAWQALMNGGYSPSWDVVDHHNNVDGSITLTVNGYSIRHCVDNFATNQVTVMPRSDGSFYYVSNVIEYNDDFAEWRHTPKYWPRMKK